MFVDKFARLLFFDHYQLRDVFSGFWAITVRVFGAVRLDFDWLHRAQQTWRLCASLVPPLASACMWSTCAPLNARRSW